MQISLRERYMWKLRTLSLQLGERTLVMGILNVTPDSFSDGGAYASVDDAVGHAVAMLGDGADIIDLGGESTRPGAGAATDEAISAEEEQRRVLPVIRALKAARPKAVLSVDTYRASTARLAVEAGAEIVNDVSGGLWDSAMSEMCARLQCGVVAMHTRGLPSQWAEQAALDEAQVLPTVLTGLYDAAFGLMFAGVDRSRIVLDPGFGFGKRGGENWVLLREMHRLSKLGFPLLVGLSRKGFLQQGEDAPRDRDDATADASATAALAGAHAVRVHDVARTRAAVTVADAQRSVR